MQGTPKTMQRSPKYKNVLLDIYDFFEKEISNITDNKKIIIDPGIGFGKTIAQNDTIIRNLYKLKRFDVPLLVGLSRKSFLTYDFNEPKDRLESSLAISALAINNGADIIRVHDINKSIEVFSIVDRLLKK